MMDYRENAGYVITDSCHVGESEFVLGVHLTAPQQFVTWKCKDRTDYYWGHYFSSLFDAQKDLVARAHEEVQYLEQRGIDPNKMELEPADSPWGEIQTCHTLCPGAYSVSTAGHGGVMVSRELADKVLCKEANLDMEVAKLNMLKASYLNQRYSLEELVLREYPADIARITERIAGYEKDVALAAAHPKGQEGFCGMVIEGKQYAEKEDAGKAIIDVCSKMTGSDAVLLGEYRGFSMVLAYDGISNEYRITLKGTLSHTVTLGADVFGNIARLDNALENLAGSLQAEQSSLEETKGQLENARAELGAPFAREEELAEKTARLNELNVLLKVDEKDKTLIDSVPDEGEEVPERKVVGLER